MKWKRLQTWPMQKPQPVPPLLWWNQFGQCEHHSYAMPVQDTSHTEMLCQWQWLRQHHHWTHCEMLHLESLWCIQMDLDDLQTQSTKYRSIHCFIVFRQKNYLVKHLFSYIDPRLARKISKFENFKHYCFRNADSTHLEGNAFCILFNIRAFSQLKISAN